MVENQRAANTLRARQRVEQLKNDLPSIISEHVDEHMQRLESKLVGEFKELGQRAIEESTAVLNEQLSDRINTLERVSALQSKTLVGLRDSSKVAEEKVSSVVDTIEKSLAGAVPGFKLDPPAEAPLPSFVHPQFQLQAPKAGVVKADTREVTETESPKRKYGFCPNCTSNNVRRANRTGLFENSLRLFFIAPFRCRACRHKFYRF